MKVKMEQYFLCLPYHLDFHAEWQKYTKMRNLGCGREIFHIIVNLNFEFSVNLFSEYVFTYLYHSKVIS